MNLAIIPLLKFDAKYVYLNDKSSQLYIKCFLCKVRLAASVATRQFLQTLPNSESRERFYPKVLPAMCLNRLDVINFRG